jgi:hypothetical protein
VAVDPEVGAVDPDPRERAARRRQPGGAEQLVAEALAHQRLVLAVVVERELLLPGDPLAGDVLGGLDLEPGAGGRQRAEVALLADADVADGDAVDRDAGAEVRVGLDPGLAGAGRLGRARLLVAQRVPVARRHRDPHVEQAIAREQRRREIDPGVGRGIGHRVDRGVGHGRIVAATTRAGRHQREGEQGPTRAGPPRDRTRSEGSDTESSASHQAMVKHPACPAKSSRSQRLSPPAGAGRCRIAPRCGRSRHRPVTGSSARRPGRAGAGSAGCPRCRGCSTSGSAAHARPRPGSARRLPRAGR